LVRVDSFVISNVVLWVALMFLCPRAKMTVITGSMILSVGFVVYYLIAVSLDQENYSRTSIESTFPSPSRSNP